MNEPKRIDDRRRLQLTLSDDLDDVLTRLSRLFNQPKSKIVTDSLNGAIPTLRKMAATAEKLESMKKGVKNILGGDHATD